MEFTKPAYNIHEHNFIDWSDERLYQRLNQLTELDQPWQGSGERLKTIRNEMAYIVFEQMERYAETHPEQTSEQTPEEIQDEIDKAWSEYERA